MERIERRSESVSPELALKQAVEAAIEKNKTNIMLARLKNPRIQEQIHDVIERHRSFFTKGPDEILASMNEAIERESSITRVMRHIPASLSHYNILTGKAKVGLKRGAKDSKLTQEYTEAHEKEHAIRASLFNRSLRLSKEMSKGFGMWAHIKNKGLKMLFLASVAFDLTVLFGAGAAAFVVGPHALRSPYMLSSHEIYARMSQLKNYFGFEGDEKFTKAHLEYARKHYVEDTGMDNNMKEFFSYITPKTEEKFLFMINTFGV